MEEKSDQDIKEVMNQIDDETKSLIISTLSIVIKINSKFVI